MTLIAAIAPQCSIPSQAESLNAEVDGSADDGLVVADGRVAGVLQGAIDLRLVVVVNEANAREAEPDGTRVVSVRRGGTDGTEQDGHPEAA